MANFIWKNRHGRYYFRVRIPARYLAHFGNSSELRSPLNTSDRSTAKRLARARMVVFDNYLNELDLMTKAKSGNGQPLKLNLDVFIDGTELPDGTKLPPARLNMTTKEALELGGPQAVASMVNAMRRGQLHTETLGGVEPL